MRLIKNAIVYRASLPSAKALADHLAEKPFTPVLESQRTSCGFIPHPITNELVSKFPEGYAVRMRLDTKPISKRAIRLAAGEKMQAQQEALGRTLTREEADEIKVALIEAAVKTTLPERIEVDAFYHIESHTLLVASTSKEVSSNLLGLLVEACGAVETSTIHVSNIKSGLTTRLYEYFENDNSPAFDGFKIGDSVAMKGKAGRASFDLENLDHAREGLVEAINTGMEVERMELCHADTVNFKLTKDFHLRGISFLANEQGDDPDFEDGIEQWLHHAGMQTLLLVATVNALCELFGYQEKVTEYDNQGSVTTEETDSDDLLYTDAVAFVREMQNASISGIQRKLQIGFNRAARFIELMEAEGIVSKPKHDGSRDVTDSDGVAIHD